jgi:hypothetical protein
VRGAVSEADEKRRKRHNCDASQSIEVLEPHLRTFARTERHVFAGTAQSL